MQLNVRTQTSTETPARDFIGNNLQEFGLLGRNNVVLPDLEREQLPALHQRFSKANHFAFGFDSIKFSRRISSSAKYWVEYGKPSRGHATFEAELTAALAEIRAEVGTFSVSASASYIISCASALCRRNNWPISVVVVEFEGYQPVLVDSNVELQRFRLDWEEFAQFALDFALLAGCSDPWIALEAFHGTLSRAPHLYDGAELRIVNNNFDDATRSIVGPADWSLVDNEKFTAIDRYLVATQRIGFPQILRWSPELIAAQLDSPQTRNWLQRASRVRASSNSSGWLNQRSRMQMVTSILPTLSVFRDSRRSRMDSALDAQMLLLGKRMHKLSPSCQNQHRYPLSRLFKMLQLDEDYLDLLPPTGYGHVREYES